MKPPKKIDIIIKPLRSAEGTKHEFISVEALKEFETQKRKQLFEKFDNHIAIGITLAFDELLKFIEQ